MGQRVLWVFLIVVLGYGVLAGRLVYIQVYEHERYVQMAADLRERTRPLPAERGALLDRNGTLLVANAPAGDVILDPNVWYADLPKSAAAQQRPVASRPPYIQAGLFPHRSEQIVSAPDAAAAPAETPDTPETRQKTALEGLSACLPDLDVAALAAKVGERTRNGARLKTLNVRRQVDETTANKIRKANLPGVAVRPAFRRVALNGDLAAHLLGFTNIDGEGLAGLEGSLNAALQGKPGLMEAEFDGRGRPIPGTVQREEPAQPGDDVLLTLDAGLQHDLQDALQKAYTRHGAEAATGVVLDPRTGDILALANCPSFNVNRRNDSPLAARANRAVESPFEPGSTLKLMTIAAALAENAVSPTSTFYCSGSRQIGRRTIHCAHGKHGNESLTDVVRESCNIATAEAAFRLGRNKLWEYERRFGFGERTGAGLPGESPGQLSRPERWSDIQLANVAFGQGISVTPLQLAAAYAAIANDGVWMRPRIVRGTRPRSEAAGALAGGDKRASKTIVREIAPEPGRRVVSPSVARTLRTMLQTVVDHGTGTQAALDGYSAGGKTGTAQIAKRGGYSSKFVSSFVGMAPAKNPQFVILIAVTAPTKNGHFGGEVAAPVFREIAQKALLARRTPHDRAPGTSANKRASVATIKGD